MRWVYDCITLGNPQQFNFEFCLWTLKVLRELIRSRLKVELSTSSLSRLLRKLGLSAQRPVYQAYRRDPGRVMEYLNVTFPEAIARAKTMDANMFFVDESAIRSDTHRGTTWGAAGETPAVKDIGGPFGMTLINGVSPHGDLRFSVIGATMDSARYIAFMKQLHRDAGGPILVVVDNAKYHHSKDTRCFIEAQDGQIELVYLPSYAPVLNPDEEVWNHAKREIGNAPS
jgi:transposase